jgi:hypothetical protein
MILSSPRQAELTIGAVVREKRETVDIYSKGGDASAQDYFLASD